MRSLIPALTIRLKGVAATIFLPLLLISVCLANGNERSEREEVRSSDQPAILVFSKTSGFRHNSIEPGIEAVKQLGQEHGITVHATEDATAFTDEYLSQYAAVLFLNTSLTLFEEDQRAVFERYIRSGGGFAGTHSAADTEYDWPWYGGLVGAWFESHPPVQVASVRLLDGFHASTEMLPDRWEKEDEWYNFRELPGHVEVLLELDTESFEGSKHPGFHPIAWYHEYDGGRAFYTGMGHTIDTWSNPLFLQHLLGGLRYAMGPAYY